jgi:hypothetical protein
MLQNGQTAKQKKPWTKQLTKSEQDIYLDARRIGSDNLESIVMDLLPNAERTSTGWKAGNIKGDKGNSLVIHGRGTRKGGWTDFGTPATMRASGDIIYLVSEALDLSVKDAAEYIISRYGRN